MSVFAQCAPYFKQFCCKQLKTKQLDEILAKVSRKLTKYVYERYLIKQ